MVHNTSIDDRRSALGADDLATLAENLREQRLFRREQLRRLAVTPAAWKGPGPGRQVAAQAEVRRQLAACARMVLVDVEAALRRMEQGCYGTCHLCRRAIALERLMIVPQARYCARCQQVRRQDR
ncbi:TraR/DksA family transcriptional regulator [Streptomyces sp. PU-14G]|uniref:TraR/DksA family transcriptional regulator n=1 Tax=Streptomyces sp. PU-14G TaxID=2800808 RepID=UPI0034DEC3A2